MSTRFPIEHENTVLEKKSTKYFENALPVEWIIDRPTDYGIDLIVNIVSKNEVIGLNFSVQLKAKKQCKEKLSVALKKSTLNYLLSRLEPAMIVLYDEESGKAYWKWLNQNDFDLTKQVKTYQIVLSPIQCIEDINWENVKTYVQRIFKTQKRLLTSLEYDLFNTSSDLECKAWAHYFKGNKHEAIFNFNRLLENEHKAIWLLAKSQCEYATYDYLNALHSINLAIELESSDDILITKGCILAEDGIRNQDFYKLRAAEKIFEVLYANNKTSTNCFNYANTSSSLGEKIRAEKLYIEALDINPNHAEAWKNLGQIYFNEKRYEEAITCYDKALNVNPYLVQAITSKGIAIGVGREDYSGALSLLSLGIEMDVQIFTKFSEIFFWLSFFNGKCGNSKDSFLWVNRGLAHSPGDPYLRNQKHRLFNEFLPFNKEYIHDAIDFFKENHLLNSNDCANYYNWCVALNSVFGEEKSREKSYEWLVFRVDIPASILEKIDIKILLNCIKYFNYYDSYLSSTKTVEISNNMASEGLVNIDLFIAELKVSRIIFLSVISELFESTISYEDAKDIVSLAIRDAVERIPGYSISRMIVTSKNEDKKAFADEFSKVLLTSSAVLKNDLIQGITYLGNRFKMDKELLHSLINPDDIKNILFRLMELLYIELNLPME